MNTQVERIGGYTDMMTASNRLYMFKGWRARDVSKYVIGVKWLKTARQSVVTSALLRGAVGSIIGGTVGGLIGAATATSKNVHYTCIVQFSKDFDIPAIKVQSDDKYLITWLRRIKDEN